MMVASGSSSHNACKAWEMHSSVLEWRCGGFHCLPNCWAIVRDVILLMMSPAMMPLTPPVGFLNAVRCPNRKTCIAASGAKPCGTPNNMCVSGIVQQWTRSTVIPDGPGAAPFRADLTFLANTSSSRMKRVSVWHMIQNVLRNWFTCPGRTSRVGQFAPCFL